MNEIVQNRLSEKNFLNKLDIKTTKDVSIKKKSEISLNQDLLPGILKTSTLGYDGKGQYIINSIKTNILYILKIQNKKNHIKTILSY